MATSEMTNLTTEGQIRYDADKKSKLVAYLLWFFLGAFGAHRFYAKRVLTGFIQLLMWLGGAALMVVATMPAWDTIQRSAEAEAAGTPDPALQQAAAEAMANIFQSPMYLAGLALFAIFAIWWLVDAFLIPGWIRRHNEALLASLAGR